MHTVTGQIENKEIAPVLEYLQANASQLQSGAAYCNFWYSEGLFHASLAGYEDGPDTALAHQERAKLFVADEQMFPSNVGTNGAHQ